MHSDNLVAIKDGALSQFDKTRAIEDLFPIQGLKAFLNKFIDKSRVMRRVSQTEDDNPPSPKSQIDSQAESYMFGSAANMPGKTMKTISSGGPASVQQPHTPASPMTAGVFGAQQHGNYAPSPSTANFPLASPPSLPGHQAKPQGQVAPSPQMNPVEHSPAPFINSPMNQQQQQLHAPSPSFMPAPSPSASTFTHSPAPSQFIASQNTPQGGGGGSVGGPDSIGSPAFNQPNLLLSSPANNPWPNSPSVPRPSPRPMATGGGTSQASPIAGGVGQFPARVLPAKNWAAAIPTLLTHQGFDNMCRVNPADMPPGPYYNLYSSYSQLERFLGTTFLRHHFQRRFENENVCICNLEYFL